MEDLNVKGIMKNHKLSRSIQELSLYRFETIFKYKSNWYERQIINIDRFFPSSKTCADCGYINNELKLSDREWICPDCGVIHDRDFNAAINIENEGLKIYKKLVGNYIPELSLMESKSLDPQRNKKEINL